MSDEPGAPRSPGEDPGESPGEGPGEGPARGRVLCFDLGERRIGVAVSDSRRLLASPRGVLERSGDRAADRRAMAAAVVEAGAVEVVVGLPLSLDGTAGRAARAVLEELGELAALLEVPVHTEDERLSTVEAARHRRVAEAPVTGAGASPRAGGAGGRRRPAGARRRGREPLDAAAAAVILQGWLDARRRRQRGPRN